ncbi:MAG TPA: AzlD domain-containing protein [Acidimicrobiia bacterium]|nr:AzlD domain-containing protein [Acidimicrobiia bacterium]
MNAWLAFGLAGIGTYLSRSLFILVVGDRPLPAGVERGLRNIGPAVLAALTASLLTSDRLGEFLGSVPEVAAVIAGIAVGIWRRSVGWSFVTSFTTWATLTLLL